MFQSKKNGGSSGGGFKKKYHQPPANSKEIHVGQELVALIKELIAVRPTEPLANRVDDVSKLGVWPTVLKMEVLFPTDCALHPDQVSDFIETTNLPGAGQHGYRSTI